MEKIIQINYQGRAISIEENAYHLFQQYENELKNYFLHEEGGDETFADLQYRMSEILEQKLKAGAMAINSQDVEDLIANIGKPSDLDPESAKKPNETQSEKKVLQRQKFKNDKIIAGVCSGIANYFSIDPIAVRLVFVLFTLFNVATLFRFNLGILGYIVLWIVLKPAYLNTNITRKLFRNPKDKVIGGVCSGLAQFFNTDSWIIRLIFLVPMLTGFITSNHFLRGIPMIGPSFYSLPFICYIILLVIVPIAKNSTDYMLLKGEPITISTIQHSTTMQTISNQSKSGLNTFLKIIAYIFIVAFLVGLFPVAITFLMGSVLSFNLADAILFSSFNKTLALFTLIFMMLLPFISAAIWGIRKLIGYREPNKALRIMFVGLHTIGWISFFVLLMNLLKDNNTYISKPETIPVLTNLDTLYVQPLQEDAFDVRDVVFEMNGFNSLIEKTPGQNRVKAVRLKYKETTEPNFSIVIEKSAFGRNRFIADEHIDQTSYEYKLEGNKLMLASVLNVTNKMPYHFQNVKVTILVPRNKALVISKGIKKQLQHSIRSNHNGFNVNIEDNDEVREDKVISFHGGSIQSVDYDESYEKATSKESNQEEMNEKKAAIEAAAKETEDKIREAQREYEDAKIEAQRKIDEAKKELEATIKDTLK